jgi:uncharacterized protein YabN with tetrapyrrole methylase and pyrophosphatase domain
MSEAFAKLRETVARLRAPDGCPWDREQTNESLVPGLIEEAYEAAAAIRANDDANLREELGDVVLLAVMHAQIASEAGRFSIDDALTEVNEKLIRRPSARVRYERCHGFRRGRAPVGRDQARREEG